nr:YadA-like family protein [Stenotrophomonas pavanii]
MKNAGTSRRLGPGLSSLARSPLMIALLLALPSAWAGTPDADEPHEDTEALSFQVQSQALWAAFGPASAPHVLGGMTSISALLAPTPYGQLTLTTDTSYRDSTLDGNHLVVVGSRSSLRGSTSVGYGNLIDSNGERNVAVGYNVKVRRGYSTAIGGDAYSDGVGTVALGHFARAYSENSIAIGSGSATVNSSAGESRIAIGGNAYAGSAGYTGAVALGGESRAEYDAIAIGMGSKARAVGALSIGRFSQASGDGSLAIGKDSLSTARQGIAVGQGANASNTGSVALGANSTTSASNQISVGSSSLKRKIVNVADATLGTSSSEAVTGKQLYATNQTLAATTSTANAAKSTADNALSKANTLSGLLSQTSSSGNVRLGAANSGSVLDVRNSANGSRRISGVADGALSTSSTEAVSGKQLYATNQNLATTTSTANAAKSTADSALSRANTLTGLLSQTSGSGNVRLGAANSGTVLDVRNSANGSRRISGVADGTLSSSSTDAVSGRQLHATNSNVTRAAADASTAMQIGAHLAGLIGQSGAAGNVRLGGSNSGSVVDVRNSGNAERLLSGVAAGSISAASAEAVNGRQLYATNQNVAKATTTANAAHTTANTAHATANTALVKVNVLDTLLSQASSTGDVRLGAGNSGTVLDIGNRTGAARRITNVANGRLSASSADAVSGQQLHATNELARAQGARLDGQGDLIADNRNELERLRDAFEDFDPDLEGVVKFSADRSHVDMDGALVTGVGAGDIDSATSTDAVNGGQLFATNQRIGQMESVGRLMAFGDEAGSVAAGAGIYGVALGNGASASPTTEGGTAVGAYSLALGMNSVAVGRGAYVSEFAEDAFALGASARVDAVGGLAIGNSSAVESGVGNSVALGQYSIADQKDTVSIGHASLQRRLTNLARGTAAHDAVAIDQLSDSLAALGGGAGLDSKGNIIRPNYTMQGRSQSTVGEALNVLDGAVVTQAEKTGRLERQLGAMFQDGIAVRADGIGQLNLAGTNGMVLSNLADGRIAAGSRDAVTGSQLFDAKADIARNRDELDRLQAGRDGAPASMGAASLVGGNPIDFGGATLTGVSDGRLAEGSSDVVNGGQLHASNERIARMESVRQLIAFGDEAGRIDPTAGIYGVALGNGATASPNSEGGTAVGAYSFALGMNSVALGRGSSVSEASTDGIAIGLGARVNAVGGLAIGKYSLIESGADNAVALGRSSIATEKDTVSLGNVSLQRRLTNVARGRSQTDATTVSQLNDTLAALGGGAHVDANGNIIRPTYAVQGSTQGSIGDALTALDTAVVTQSEKTERVERQLGAMFQGGATVRADGIGQLNLAGANGMVLGNVANGLVAAGSRDAVNGGQLHAMQDQLNTRIDGVEKRIDEQPQPGLRTASASGDTPQPASAGDGDGAIAAARPKAEAPAPDAPTPQVDTAELERMLARANDYSDGISREVDRRLEKMDKRFNRMAAMTSAQSAMAMNTAGLNTYNRLGAGVGYSDGESAMAVGYQRVLNQKGSATFSLNGAFTNSGERSMGVGVGIGW